jgi:hypothetical protein
VSTNAASITAEQQQHQQQKRPHVLRAPGAHFTSAALPEHLKVLRRDPSEKPQLWTPEDEQSQANPADDEEMQSSRTNQQSSSQRQHRRSRASKRGGRTRKSQQRKSEQAPQEPAANEASGSNTEVVSATNGRNSSTSSGANVTEQSAEHEKELQSAEVMEASNTGQRKSGANGSRRRKRGGGIRSRRQRTDVGGSKQADTNSGNAEGQHGTSAASAHQNDHHAMHDGDATHTESANDVEANGQQRRRSSRTRGGRRSRRKQQQQQQEKAAAGVEPEQNGNEAHSEAASRSVGSGAEQAEGSKRTGASEALFRGGDDYGALQKKKPRVRGGQRRRKGNKASNTASESVVVLEDGRSVEHSAVGGDASF